MSGFWFEVTVDVPHPHSEAVANFLIESGAPGLQMEEGDGTTSLIAYFATEPGLDGLRRLCRDLGCWSADGEALRVRQVAADDWAESWKLHFPPQLIGDTLYVCPPWNRTAPPGRIAVVIDPGMAFGTGHHATTRGCLTLLERAARTRAITRALDVGTGSGVLAIALAELGAEVWAVDNDPIACGAAAANSARNGVTNRIHLTSDWGYIAGRFELVTANLFTQSLEEFAPEFRRFMPACGGTVICSGILCEEEHRVRTAYEACGFRMSDRYVEAPWVTLAFRNGPAS